MDKDFRKSCDFTHCQTPSCLQVWSELLKITGPTILFKAQDSLEESSKAPQSQKQ